MPGGPAPFPLRVDVGSSDMSQSGTNLDDSRLSIDSRRERERERDAPSSIEADGESRLSTDDSDVEAMGKLDVALLAKALKGATSGQRAKENDDMRRTAIVCAQGFMAAGTDDEGFIRARFRWFKQAKGWVIFASVASMGAIHRFGITDQSWLQAYLPDNQFVAAVTQDPEAAYAPAGAVFALGLCHAGAASKSEHSPLPQLLSYLQMATQTQSAPMLHATGLSMGLVSMGTHDITLFDDLWPVTLSADPDTGMGSALGCGLLMLGSVSKAQTEAGQPLQERLDMMLNQARDTEHERVARSCAVGLAFACYECRQDALPLIKTLENERRPQMREGAAWARALAFAGSGDLDQLRLLLRLGMNDSDDNVRRAAFIGVALLLADPEETVKALALSTRSYSPHIRSGAALGIGLACAGTGNRRALTLLRDLEGSLESYVVQSSLMAQALVLQLQPSPELPEDEKEAEEEEEKKGKKGKNGKKKKQKSRKERKQDKEDQIEKQKAEQSKPLPETPIYAAEFRKRLVDMLVNTRRNRDPLALFGARMALGLINASGGNVSFQLKTRLGFNSALGMVSACLFGQGWFWHPMMLTLCLGFSPMAFLPTDGSLSLSKRTQLACSAPKASYSYPAHYAERVKKKKAEVRNVKLSLRERSGTQEQDDMLIFIRRAAAHTAEAYKAEVALMETETQAPGDEGAQAEDDTTGVHTLRGPCRMLPHQADATTWAEDSPVYPVYKNRLTGIVVVTHKEGQE
ncbi:hypothetical protein KIPB_000937, partial [Kipferlia bialata]|eukprot:g937.t1